MEVPKSSSREDNERYLDKEPTNDRTEVEFPIVSESNEDQEDDVDSAIDDDHSVEDREDQVPDL